MYLYFRFKIKENLPFPISGTFLLIHVTEEWLFVSLYFVQLSGGIQLQKFFSSTLRYKSVVYN